MITRRSFVLLAAAAFSAGTVGCGGGSGSDASPDPNYAPAYDIVSLGSQFSRVVAINNRGQVLGYDRNGKAAVTGLDGSLSVINFPSNVFDATDLEGTAVALNDLGAVIGNYHPQHVLARAYLWQDGAAQDLGTFGGRWASAEGLNNRNQVVGSARVDEFGRALPFIWENGQMSPVIAADGTGVLGRSITNSGVIMGFFYRPEPNSQGAADSGLALFENGVIRRIYSPAGGYLPAVDINDNGQILGYHHIADGENGGQNVVHIWEDGEITNITAKGGEAGFTSPMAFNRLGEIVGGASTLGGVSGPPPIQPEQRAFLYSAGKTLNLQTQISRESGWDLVIALDINDRGQIIGNGVFHGQQVPFLLTKR